MLFALLFSLQTAAADVTDLKAKAIQEIEHVGEKKSTSTDAQATGILKLNDPQPQLLQRQWDYFVQLSAQQFEPRGLISNGLTDSKFDLSASGASLMPVFEMGFLAPLYRGDWKWNWGLSGRLGYVSQKSSALFTTGFKQTDVRMNTSMISLNPMVSFRVPGLSKVAFDLGGETGLLDYSQSSSDELANVNQHAGYWGVTLGAEYFLLEQWSVVLKYSRKDLWNDNQQIALQRNFWELGTRFIW